MTLSSIISAADSISSQIAAWDGGETFPFPEIDNSLDTFVVEFGGRHSSGYLVGPGFSRTCIWNTAHESIASTCSLSEYIALALSRGTKGAAHALRSAVNQVLVIWNNPIRLEGDRVLVDRLSSTAYRKGEPYTAKLDDGECLDLLFLEALGPHIGPQFKLIIINDKTASLVGSPVGTLAFSFSSGTGSAIVLPKGIEVTNCSKLPVMRAGQPLSELGQFTGSKHWEKAYRALGLTESQYDCFQNCAGRLAARVVDAWVTHIDKTLCSASLRTEVQLGREQWDGPFHQGFTSMVSGMPNRCTVISTRDEKTGLSIPASNVLRLFKVAQG